MPQGPSNEVLGQVFTQMIGGIAVSHGARQAGAGGSAMPGALASGSGTGPARPSTSAAIGG